jgi:GABA permease
MSEPAETTATTTHRILVIANETVEGRVLYDTILARAGAAGKLKVLVICPALNSRLRHWLSDEDGARRAAEGRLQNSLVRLSGEGIEVEGWVGDADPLQAIADGLHVFGASEIIIATHPEGRSHWLERDLIGRARERFEPPIVHVVVDGAQAPAAAA